MIFPEIDYVDCLNGIVYFKNYSNNYQIEVYKYTKYKKCEHKSPDVIYEEHHGKRFVPQFFIKKQQMYWEIPTMYLTNQKRNYFKFAFVDLSCNRGTLSSFTIKTLNLTERTNLGSKFILI